MRWVGHVESIIIIKMHKKFYEENLTKRDNYGDIDMNAKIMLKKWMLNMARGVN
jgi:hypothetical protein